MNFKKILAKSGAIAAVAASTVLMSGAMSHAQQPPDQQGSYVAAPTTTIDLTVLPPAPPVFVTTTVVQVPVGTIPKTGSNGVGSTSTIAATIAAAGVGMVFAARRRRETTAN